MLSDLARGKEGDDGELEIYLDLGKSAKNVNHFLNKLYFN